MNSLYRSLFLTARDCSAYCFSFRDLHQFKAYEMQLVRVLHSWESRDPKVSRWKRVERLVKGWPVTSQREETGQTARSNKRRIATVVFLKSSAISGCGRTGEGSWGFISRWDNKKTSCLCSFLLTLVLSLWGWNHHREVFPVSPTQF